MNPTRDPLSLIDPLAQFLPDRLTPKKDTCSCTKKKPKKREPRDVCYRGTYVQHSKGISYNKLEEVPCVPAPKKSVSKRETDAFGRPVPGRSKRKKTPKWGDIVDQVFPRP